MIELTRYPLGLLDEVDGREQANPNDIDEVPVIGHDDGADLLFMSEALGGVGTCEQEDERDETAGHVQAVEPHEEGQHVPLAQPPLHEVENRCRTPDLATLNGEHAHLAGDTGQHEHGRVRRAKRDVQMSHGPKLALTFIYRTDREVHREQRSKEHELAGQPDDGAHTHQVRSAGRGARYRCRLGHGCCRHSAIITTPRRGCAPDPPTWRSCHSSCDSSGGGIRLHSGVAGPVGSQSMKVVVYSHDADTRAEMKLAIGTRPAPDAPEAEIVEVATAPALFRLLDAGGVDVMVLDGEAQPAGGMGVSRQAKDEIYNCPPALLIIARADDRWLATWSKADAVVSHPIDPVALARELAALMRARVSALPTAQ